MNLNRARRDDAGFSYKARNIANFAQFTLTLQAGDPPASGIISAGRSLNCDPGGR